jgi:hypothetical protein
VFHQEPEDLGGLSPLRLVILTRAPILLDRGVKPDSLAVAAWVRALVDTVVEFRHHRVEGAVIDLSCDEALATIGAVEVREAGEEFQEDLLPGQVLLLSQIHNELVDVP